MDRVLSGVASVFAMSDAVWARHANPWSGWTRVPIGPLLALAIWSRAWIDAWCWLPILALLVWTWVNPRAFPPPKDPSNWMSKAVYGERLLIQTDAALIPAHHRKVVHGLSLAPVLGVVPLVYGLWVFDPWAVVAGLALAMLPKFWFLDRMVWLFGELSATRPDLDLIPKAG